MKYLHTVRCNEDLFKLASLMMALEDTLEYIDDPACMVYWEKMNRRANVWNEEWENDKWTLSDNVRYIWENGRFDGHRDNGDRYMTNYDELFGDGALVKSRRLNGVLGTFARILVLDIRALAGNIFNGDRTFIKSKKRLLRMLRDIHDTNFNLAYDHHEWFFVQHCRPVLDILEHELHYINALQWRF